MKEAEEESNDVEYCRKPLTFVLPGLRDSQAKKNPFKSFVKLKTMDFPVHMPTMSPTIAQPEPEPAPIKKFLSLTPTSQRRTRIDLTRIPKPSLFAAEPEEITNKSFEEETKAAPVPGPVSNSHPASGKALCLPPKAEGPFTQSKKIQSSPNIQDGGFEDVPEYEFSVTKEIEYHFQQLEKIGFISMEEVAKKFTLLPELSPTIARTRKTLVLDLDDTLVHTIHPKLNYTSIRMNKADIKSVVYEDPALKSLIPIKVVLRPFALRFLQEVKPLFELVVLLIGIRRCSRRDIRTTRGRFSRCSTRPTPS
jgi:hypothetical protein